jgi:hypothetical protein
MDDQLARTKELYLQVNRLPRVSYPFSPSSLPRNGIYLFFEDGEVIDFGGKYRDRIVRVGTHTKDDRFRTRIRQHYGQVNSERGNKNGSIFRKHLGGALLSCLDTEHPALPDWYHNKVKGPEEHEIAVSRRLRQTFTFVCFEVSTAAERLELESGLIAQLAQYPIGSASPSWIGHFAKSESMRSFGLWNTQRVSAEPLSAGQLKRISELVERSI